MAEPLKASYGIDVAQRIGAQLGSAWPAFDTSRFLHLAGAGYEELEFMARARQIATAMRACLPDNFIKAADIVESSLGPVHAGDESWGLKVFDYAPHGYWVAEHAFEPCGSVESQHNNFDRAMVFQHALTQRFTAEFSIRQFVQADPPRAMTFLNRWVRDPSADVRRLVSEGLRPRLPWAGRLTVFADNPAPVLELLHCLRDDPSEYVRRSVANHLNDLGKSNAQLLVSIAGDWLKGSPSKSRHGLVRHALRSLIKQGHPKALRLMGYDPMQTSITQVILTPERLPIGARLNIQVHLKAPANQACLIDLRVHYQKANGTSSIKVFKWTECVAPQSGDIRLQRNLSFEQRTTRVHYPGKHRLELLVNGAILPLGYIDLVSA